MITSLLFAGLALQSQAQVNAIDSVMNHVKGNKLSVGGYGESRLHTANSSVTILIKIQSSRQI